MSLLQNQAPNFDETDFNVPDSASNMGYNGVKPVGFKSKPAKRQDL